MVREVVAQVPRETLTAHWDYQTVLLLALGYLPEGVNRLTANSGKWNGVVCGLKEQFPEFFLEVHFAYRDPLPPYSDQLDDFLFFAGIADVLEITSPGYQVYSITDAVKIRLREKEGKFSQEQRTAIKEMSGVMGNELIIL